MLSGGLLMTTCHCEFAVFCPPFPPRIRHSSRGPFPILQNGIGFRLGFSYREQRRGRHGPVGSDSDLENRGAERGREGGGPRHNVNVLLAPDRKPGFHNARRNCLQHGTDWRSGCIDGLSFGKPRDARSRACPSSGLQTMADGRHHRQRGRVPGRRSPRRALHARLALCDGDTLTRSSRGNGG